MKEKVVNLIGIRPNIILCRTEFIKGRINTIYMEPITEEQELRIDKSAKYFGSIRYERPDGEIIDSKHIYVYGEINFDDDNDIRQIKRMKFINENGNYVHSNFDYEKGQFITVDGKVKTYPTWNPLIWFKYCHCIIGKPQRIIVYSKVSKRR